jgi:hypothetical protein
MKKKDNQSTVGELTMAIMKQYGIDKKYLQFKALQELNVLLGPMNKFVVHAEIKNRALLIQVNSAPFRAELHSSRNLLKDQINSALPEPIIDIVQLF